MLDKISKIIPEEIGEYNPQCSDRILHPKLKSILLWFCLLYTTYHLIYMASSFVTQYYHAVIHLTCLLIITFILYPMNNKKINKKLRILYSFGYTIIGTLIAGYFCFLVLNISNLYLNIILCLIFLFLIYLKIRDLLQEHVIHELDILLSFVGLIFVGFIFYFLLSGHIFLKFNIDRSFEMWLIVILAIFAATFIFQLVNSITYFTRQGKTFFDENTFPLTDRIFLLLIAYLGIYLLIVGSGSCYISEIIDKSFLVEGILFITILEAIRRVLGSFIAIIILLLFGYAIIGNYLESFVLIDYFSHSGISLNRLLHSLFCETGKAYDFPFSSGYNYILVFIITFVFLFQTGVLNSILCFIASMLNKYTNIRFQAPYWMVTFANNVFGNYSISAHTQFASPQLRLTYSLKPILKAEAINITLNVISHFSLPFLGLLFFVSIEQYPSTLPTSSFLLLYFVFTLLLWSYGFWILYLWQKEKNFQTTAKPFPFHSQLAMTEGVVIFYPIMVLVLFLSAKPAIFISFFSFTYLIAFWMNRKSNNLLLPLIILSFPLILQKDSAHFYLSVPFIISALLSLSLLVYLLKSMRNKVFGLYSILAIVGITGVILLKSVFLTTVILLWMSIIIYCIQSKSKQLFRQLFDDILLAIKIYVPIGLGCLAITFIANVLTLTGLMEKFSSLMYDGLIHIKEATIIFSIFDAFLNTNIIFTTILVVFVTLISYLISMNLPLIPRYVLISLLTYSLLSKLGFSTLWITFATIFITTIMPIYSFFSPVIYNRFNKLSLPNSKSILYLTMFTLPIVLLSISILSNKTMTIDNMFSNTMQGIIQLVIYLFAMLFMAASIQNHLFSALKKYECYIFYLLAVSSIIGEFTVGIVSSTLGLAFILYKKYFSTRKKNKSNYSHFYK